MWWILLTLWLIDIYISTSHVSQPFASCTHNTSYSLLNIVHVIVCVFGLTNQVWKILWVLCTTDLLLKKKGEIVWNLNFWENWVLNLGFVKIISSHTHAFFFFLQCFEERLLKIMLIFKNSFFLQFRSIESVFRSIEIVFKNFSKSLPGSIDRTCFSINQTSWIKFFF